MKRPAIQCAGLSFISRLRHRTEHKCQLHRIYDMDHLTSIARRYTMCVQFRHIGYILFCQSMLDMSEYCVAFFDSNSKEYSHQSLHIAGTDHVIATASSGNERDPSRCTSYILVYLHS